MLELTGMEVREAENGLEGLRLFREWAPGLVLMDMRMPVMDGYEAIRRIKATDQGKDPDHRHHGQRLRGGPPKSPGHGGRRLHAQARYRRRTVRQNPEPVGPRLPVFRGGAPRSGSIGQDGGQGDPGGSPKSWPTNSHAPSPSWICIHSSNFCPRSRRTRPSSPMVRRLADRYEISVLADILEEKR